MRKSDAVFGRRQATEAFIVTMFTDTWLTFPVSAPRFADSTDPEFPVRNPQNASADESDTLNGPAQLALALSTGARGETGTGNRKSHFRIIDPTTAVASFQPVRNDSSR